MFDIIKFIADSLKLRTIQVENTVKLLDEWWTVPFISRYRKEATWNLDEEQIRKIEEKLIYIRNLEARKQEILKSIEEQWKLTDELKMQILACDKLQKLEDLYLPYKKAKKTKADIAIENGLQPLADFMRKTEIDISDITKEAQNYLNENVKTIEDAINWAKLIIAQEISQNPTYREYIRGKLKNFATIYSKVIVKNQDKDEKQVYKDYYSFSEPLNKIASHRILALNRGEKEKILSVSIKSDERDVYDIKRTILMSFPNKKLENFYLEIIQDSLDRLIFPSVENEVRNIFTELAEQEAISMFKKNLYNLLMQPPIIGKNVLWLDPWFRTWCKVVVIDKNGEYVENNVMYLIQWDTKLSEAEKLLSTYIIKYDIDIIAIGNGTASRETEKFVADLLKTLNLKKDLKYIIVNEAWASVYSASILAKEEFPSLDVTVRGAISIAKRVQDPLAELVKIDPKSIWVWMYQHDINQSMLETSLNTVVESAVNNVWVNVNTASWALLSFVSGVSKVIAKNIVKFRSEIGQFNNRSQLKKVKWLWPKAFEQAAGFIVIPWSSNPLDDTIVHPESYDIAEKILKQSGFKIKDLIDKRKDIQESLVNFDIKKFAEDNGFWFETCNDILQALMKPRRDPRENMPQPLLKSDVLKIEDLEDGMELEWTVRNVINFGAFVDIWLKNDALLHISQFPWKEFVSDPTRVLVVWDIIKAKVLSIEIDRWRVNLTMKEANTETKNDNKTSSDQQKIQSKPKKTENKELGGSIKFF